MDDMHNMILQKMEKKFSTFARKLDKMIPHAVSDIHLCNSWIKFSLYCTIGLSKFRCLSRERRSLSCTSCKRCVIHSCLSVIQLIF